MDENIETLVSMGFTDRDLNRRALHKADNDISEAVSFLTGSTPFTDDSIIPTESTTTMSTFIGPLTKEQLEQQQMVRSVRSLWRETEKNDRFRRSRPTITPVSRRRCPPKT